MHYIVNIAVTLAIGGLSSILTNDATRAFPAMFEQSSLTPPASVFPVVWTILYILMAIGYTMTGSCDSERGRLLYWIQLGFNFLWPIVFFNFNWFLFAFIWLAILLILVIFMSLEFFKCKPIAGILQIPYILWLIFAGYLNFMVFLLN